MQSRVAGNPEAAALLDEADEEVRSALRELRELARGIHPAVLTDQGLDAAVRTLAERAPYLWMSPPPRHACRPTSRLRRISWSPRRSRTLPSTRAPPEAWVTIDQRNGSAFVEVSDDGCGGARLDDDGSGLRGLADRVAALNGRLDVESPPGGGTRLHAEIPCAS